MRKITFLRIPSGKNFEHNPLSLQMQITNLGHTPAPIKIIHSALGTSAVVNSIATSFISPHIELLTLMRVWGIILPFMV